MHKETWIGIDPITNNIDAPAEWWDCKIKHNYHNLFSEILATCFVSRCPTRFSQASGTETWYGQEGLNYYRDSESNEIEGSDESDGPTRDDNIARTVSTDGLGRATSCGKRKLMGGSNGTRKKIRA
ncbi:hypothetical protein Fot_12037 [Forsythia ovata]|uniref:Uncharacterized protein n=1 Tax=Forsythia ovata TaxID=205694 RepID=A0ABD1WLJ9_9LAMI